MAERKSQETDVQLVFRRQTRDLKDVQDVLKSVMESSGQFMVRHNSINEIEEQEDTEVKKASILVRLPGNTQHPIVQKEQQLKPVINDSVEETDRGGGGTVNNSSNGPVNGLKRSQSERPAPLYGEIIVLGTNGSLPCVPLSPKMSHKYILKKQVKPTGVSLIVKNPVNDDSLSRVSTHTVSMTLAKNRLCVMEFGPDSAMDMFQIGRSADSAIDLVVVDMVNSEDGSKVPNSNSTVSRYACRILCERVPPYTARIYAAAFDTKGKIQMSPMAPTWVDSITGDTDGLTTNGVAILRPIGAFESGVEPGEWMEVTVMGNVRKMRPERSSRIPNSPLLGETSILTDGCLIDLCGVTLMWRSAMGLDQGLSNTLLRERKQALNEMAPQCPVNLLTLHFKSGELVPSPVIDEDREPWVYLSCGHVFGQHQWKGSPEESNRARTCPICRRSGLYVKLELAQERAFFVDDGALSCAFVPCGHVTTEQTAKYWSKVLLPHLATSWTHRCPFCRTELELGTPYVKLLFN